MMSKHGDTELERMLKEHPLLKKMKRVDRLTYLEGEQTLDDKSQWGHLKYRTGKFKSALQEMEMPVK